MCCVTPSKDKVFLINQLISCNLCYLCLLKLNVELVLECHSSIADDSSSLLRALVNLIQSRLHQECSSLVLTLRSCWDIYFWFSFLPFAWEIRKRIWKTDLKNCGLARARIINKENTAVHENSFSNLFRISHRTVKRKSMKSGFGFLNWHPPWRSIAKSEIRISQSNAT